MDKKTVLLLGILAIAICVSGCSKKSKAAEKLKANQIIRLSEPQPGCANLATYKDALRDSSGDSSKEAEVFKGLLANNFSGCDMLPANTDLTVSEIGESHDGYDFVSVADLTSAFAKQHGYATPFYIKWKYPK